LTISHHGHAFWEDGRLAISLGNGVFLEDFAGRVEAFREKKDAECQLNMDNCFGGYTAFILRELLRYTVIVGADKDKVSFSAVEEATRLGDVESLVSPVSVFGVLQLRGQFAVLDRAGTFSDLAAFFGRQQTLDESASVEVSAGGRTFWSVADFTGPIVMPKGLTLPTVAQFAPTPATALVTTFYQRLAGRPCDGTIEVGECDDAGGAGEDSDCDSEVADRDPTPEEERMMGIPISRVCGVDWRLMRRTYPGRFVERQGVSELRQEVNSTLRKELPLRSFGEAWALLALAVEEGARGDLDGVLNELSS
jgi:hypothetical protein